MNKINNDILIKIQSYINIYEQLLISKEWFNNIKYILIYRCNILNININKKLKIKDIINTLIECSHIKNIIIKILLKYDDTYLNSINNIDNKINIKKLKTYFNNINEIHYNDFQLSTIFKDILNKKDITNIRLFNIIKVNSILTNNVSGINKNAYKYKIICIKNLDNLCDICNLYPELNNLEKIKKHYKNKKYITKKSCITIYNLYQSKEIIKSCMNLDSYKYEKYKSSNCNFYLDDKLKNEKIYILDINYIFEHI